MTDKLNETTTAIALKLINGDCNQLYKETMIALFRDSPGFIDDVDPEYQDQFRAVIGI